MSKPIFSSPRALLRAVLDRLDGAEERHAAAGHDAFLGRGLGRVQGVVDAGPCASFISVSVAAPTLMTATPPVSLARRSWSFSRS